MVRRVLIEFRISFRFMFWALPSSPSAPSGVELSGAGIVGWEDNSVGWGLSRGYADSYPDRPNVG